MRDLVHLCVCAKSLQLCLTLCNPMNCSLPGFSVHEDSPGNNTRMGCHSLLQGIFPTQGLNPSLPDCRQTLYCWATGEALVPLYPGLKTNLKISISVHELWCDPKTLRINFCKKNMKYSGKCRIRIYYFFLGWLQQCLDTENMVSQWVHWKN